MPIDPSISLQAGAPSAGAGGAAGGSWLTGSNPLSLATGLAGLGRTAAETSNLQIQNQNYQNQVQKFQAEFGARQKAGAIIAAAPSIEDGLAAVMKNPDIMANAPTVPTELKNYINAGLEGQLRRTQIGQAQAETDKTNSGIARDAASGFTNAMLGAASDPTKIPTIMAGHLAMVPAGQRAAAQAAMQSVVQSVTSGLPGEPGSPEYVDKFRKNLVSTVMGSGMDTSRAFAGTGGIAPQAVPGAFGPGGGPAVPIVGGVPPTVAAASPTGADVPAAPVPVGQPVQKTATDEATGRAIPAYQEELNKTASAIPVMALRLNNLESALQQAQAGGGAQFRSQVGSMMQGLSNAATSSGLSAPFTKEQIDGVANGSLSATQFFQGQVAGMLTKQLASDAQGTGRVMLPEVTAALNAASVSNDPRMLQEYLGQARQALQMSYQKVTGYNDYVRELKSGKNPALAGMNELDYDRHFLQTADPTKLPAKTAGGIRLAPSEAPLRGAEPSASVDWSKYHR